MPQKKAFSVGDAKCIHLHASRQTASLNIENTYIANYDDE